MGFPDDISAIAQQLRRDTSLLYKEIYWALGEERINRVTPTMELLSSAEADLNPYSLFPTAYAVGCHMPPLCGWG